VILNKPKVVIRDSGWKVTFIKVDGGPSKPDIVPDLIPSADILKNDKALAAYVILPESGGQNQYWVTVSERLTYQGLRFAQLQTADWTVIFLRDPLT
jgi:hypothetical protein